MQQPIEDNAAWKAFQEELKSSFSWLLPGLFEMLHIQFANSSAITGETGERERGGKEKHRVETWGSR